MKTIKKIALGLCAIAILLVGCKHEFSGTDLNTASLKEEYASGRSNQGITNLTVDGTLSNTKDQVVAFGATGKVDWDSLKDALTIYQLSNAEDDTKPIKRGDSIPFTIQDVRNNIAYLLFDLPETVSEELEFYVDATKLTGSNGVTKLNLDGDRIQGEAGDDDFVYYLSVNDVSASGGKVKELTTGVQRKPREDLLSTFDTIAFVDSDPTDTDARFDKFTLSFGDSNPTDTDARFDKFTLSFGDSNPTDTDARFDKFTFERTYLETSPIKNDKTDYKKIFDSVLIIEKFDFSTEKWTTVSTTSTFDRILHPDNFTEEVYEYKFAKQPEGTVLRARTEKLQEIKTEEPIAGYIRKASYNADDTHKIFDTAVSGQEDTTKESKFITDDSEITDAIAGIDVVFDNKGYNGSVVINFNSDKKDGSGDYEKNWIEFTTDLTKDNFKLFSDNAYIPWTEIKQEVTGSDAIVRYVIKLDPKYKEQENTFQLVFAPTVQVKHGRAEGETATSKSMQDNARINKTPYGWRFVPVEGKQL